MEDRKSRAAKAKRTQENDLALDLEPVFPAPMLASAIGASKSFRIPHHAWLSMRLYFQPSRAEFVERREEESNLGMIELYCKLCERLIVASRDEFVLPIAVKAHKCGDPRKRCAAPVKGRIGPAEILNQRRSRMFET
jgi:hypothetical protein